MPSPVPPMTPYVRYSHHSLCAETLARKTPPPHNRPATVATALGPTRFIHSPPRNALHPRKNQLIKNVRVTSEIVQPNSLVRGIRKTLHAYAAPNAICKQTPATAIHQRFDTRIVPPRASEWLPRALPRVPANIALTKSGRQARHILQVGS